jgi:hypothetical protein
MSYKQRFNKKYGFSPNESHSLNEIAKISGIRKSILEEVKKRGIGAWKTNISSVRLKKDFSKNPNLKKYPRSARLTKEQWSFARIYSFVMGGKTQSTADKDLWDKHLKSKKG